MKILVIGGTRFFGIPMVEELLRRGHEVTIATRGRAQDPFGDSVERLVIERIDANSMKNVFVGRWFDIVIDKIAYCSNDIKSAMESLTCGKYIYMSSTAVYEPKHFDTREADFDGLGTKCIWCDRQAFPYDGIKRQAEYALWQEYADRNWIAVRYPFVIGRDDYTERLRFYVEHTMKGIPMNIDNLDCQMGFIGSDEAGKFMAFLAETDYKGPVNGCSAGTVSVREIINYVEARTGAKAVICAEGDTAPYNGEPEYSINTEVAAKLGFRFSNLKEWIFELVDYYIERICNEK